MIEQEKPRKDTLLETIAEVLTEDVGRLIEDSTCLEDSNKEYIVPKQPATPQLTLQALLKQQQRVVDAKEITGLQLSQEAETESDDEEPQAALSPAKRARTWLSNDHS
ncbi:hypothetical protein OPT61_g6719 [Boeremia exigua]|uniref:Uncharacterized protein n=1 Tax=Boeremia exigua TaxID=749465 RepID=A0ACC2I5L9_9PLEO|nr:hypothetical protein OPT61_g6719 [Boeremia exigua]